MLFHEASVGLVLIEGADDVVAVGPGVGPGLVFVVTVRISVMDYVEPVPRPAFAVARGGEQAIHQFFVSVGGFVGEEGVGFVGRRRQAVEVVGEAADQGTAVGLRGRGESLFGEFGPDKSVDTRRGRFGKGF